MSLYKHIEYLKAQRVDTERMLALVSSHPVMSISLLEKLKFLNDELLKIPEGQFEAKVRLLFSGKAVKGSIGIKTSFVSKVIAPMQELIKTQAALVRFGNVSKRGQAKKGATSELFLTSLPVGSFGVELSQLETKDLFDEKDVSDSIIQVIDLIDATASSDEKFERIAEEVPKRSLNNLRRLFKEVADEDSILEMESGERYVEIPVNKMKEGYERLAFTDIDESQVVIDGVLRGVLLDSGKFEIIDEEGRKISGVISDELSEQELIEYDKRFLNSSCKIHLSVNRTKFKTGNEKTLYELLNIWGE